MPTAPSRDNQSGRGLLEQERRRRRGFLFLLGFGLFLLALFAHVLIQPGAVTLGRQAGDARNQFYGWRAYGFGEIKSGHLPLWDPYEHMGMPFVASIQSAMFYPLNWLCAVFPIGRGINLSIILGLFLSGMFTYLWCRRVGIGRAGGTIAGMSYALAGPQLLRVFEGHWSFLAPMSWIPCLFLCAEMLAGGGAVLPAAALGAFAVGMQLLGGNPQYAFYGGIAASLYFLARLWLNRPSKRRAAAALGGFAAMYLVGALLSAVQMGPALELLSVSSRKGQLSYEWVSQYSLAPESLLTLLVPDLFGSDASSQYWGRWNLWEMSAYIGATAFGLCVAAFATRRRKLLWPVCVITGLLLLLAIGKYGPLLELCYRFLPGFDLFRVPARFLAPISLLLALMAGLGADTLVEIGQRVGSLDPIRQEDELREARRRLRVPIFLLATLAVLLVGVGLPLSAGLPGMRESWIDFMDRMLRIAPEERLYLQYMSVTPPFMAQAMADAGLSMLLSGLFFGAATLAALLAKEGTRATVIAAVLIAAVGIDLWGFGRRYLATFDPRDDGLTPGAVQWLKQRPAPFRFARAGDFEFPSCEGMTHRLCSLEGIQPNVPARFRDALWVFQGFPKTKQTTTYDVLTPAAPLRMMNLQYFVQYPDNPPARVPELTPGVYKDDRIRIDALPNPWPRAWMVHHYSVIPDPDELLYTLTLLNYEQSALFEEDPGVALARPNAPESPPKVTRYESDLVEIAAEPAADALLILSDLHYPGWRATVDGEPVPLVRANYLMRAVALKPGAHTVRFEYKPRSFRIGAALSGAAVVILLLMLFLPRWVGRKGPLPSKNGEDVGRKA
jgi:hypothetical protein